MRFSLIKLFLLVFLFAAVVFPTNKVSAQDNDVIDVDCTISIGIGNGAVKASKNKDSAPTVPHSSEETQNLTSQESHTYEIEVCLESDPGLDIEGKFRGDYLVASFGNGFDFNNGTFRTNLVPNNNGCLSGTVNSGPSTMNGTAIDIETPPLTGGLPMCTRQYVRLSNFSQNQMSRYDQAIGSFCKNITIGPPPLIIGKPVTISGNFASLKEFVYGIYLLNDYTQAIFTPDGTVYKIQYNLEDRNKVEVEGRSDRIFSDTYTFSKTYSNLVQGRYTPNFWGEKLFDPVNNQFANNGPDILNLCSNPFSIGTPDNPGQVFEPTNRGGGNNDPYSLCAQIPSTEVEAINECAECLRRPGIWTALGCIPTDGAGTIRSFVSIALGMAGGIGLLMIIASGAMFALSQNDPTKVNSAKDLLTSVIIGLLFIVFSVTILQFIGVTILQIPGFGT